MSGVWVGFGLLIFGLLVMFLGEKSKSSFPTVFGAILALSSLGSIDSASERNNAAKAAMKETPEFIKVVEANPDCKVRPNADGKRIVIDCPVGEK